MTSDTTEQQAAGRSEVLDRKGLIDFVRLGALLRRRWLVIFAVSLAVAAMAFLAYRLQRPVYEASAQVALDRREAQLGEQTSTDLPTDSPAVDTEVQVLGSPAVAARVVDKLGLARDPAFTGDATTPAAARENAIAALQGKVDIKRTGLSYAIAVTTRSFSPTKAANIANGVVDEYVAARLGNKEAERQRQIRLLRQRIQQLRTEVVSAESAISSYRARNGLVDVTPGGTNSSQATVALNGQLAQAQAEQAAAQARLATARGQLARGSSGEALGAALNSEVVQGLRAQQAQLSTQRADMVGRYGPLHPDLARVDRQLAEVDARIKAEVNRVISNLESEARVASGRASSLQSSIGRNESALQAENAASVRLNDLQRSADAARNLYQTFLDQYRAAVARQGTDQTLAHVIAHALPPAAPVSPNPIVYTLIGLVGALLAAGLAVTVLEMMESGVKTSEDVEEELGVPSIGLIPDLSTIPGVKVSRRDPIGPSQYLIGNPSSVFAESFRAVRTNLKRSGAKVVAITSALPAEGKTTLSICLARSAALAGQRVLLIDSDLRQRATTRRLNVDTQTGFAEVLAGSCTLDQAMVVDEASGAFLLPQAGATNDFDLLGSEAMRRLMTQVRDRFDLVLLDCAPVLPVVEARQAAALTDRVVLAVRWGATPRKAIGHAMRMLDQVGAVTAGVVLTRADLRAMAKSGYGDPTFYYNKYKTYYA